MHTKVPNEQSLIFHILWFDPFQKWRTGPALEGKIKFIEKPNHKWSIVRNSEIIAFADDFTNACNFAIAGDLIKPYKLFWLN